MILVILLVTLALLAAVGTLYQAIGTAIEGNPMDIT